MLMDQIEELEEAVEARPVLAPNVLPHLVFKMPVAKGTPVETLVELLQKAGLTVVSIEPDSAIVAFKDDGDLHDFRQAVETYRSGPRINPTTGEPYKSTQWDMLEFIEAERITRWGRNDRIGNRLLQEIGPNGGNIDGSRLYKVEVELWERDGMWDESLRELGAILPRQSDNERVLDQYHGRNLWLVKLVLSGANLQRLLDLDVVAEAETPPSPQFDVHAAFRAGRRDFPVPPRPAPNGPRVCVLDSGVVSEHPLLVNNVAAAQSVLTANASAADQNGHGTMVGGIAVFGDVRACYESGTFSSPVWLCSARVLNEDNVFDDDSLVIHQMQRAIQTFKAEPHNCRVFNISIGTPAPAFANGRRHQPLWAEALDVLAREEQVLIVVAAGNVLPLSLSREEAEAMLKGYPHFLLAEQHQLCDPATAAIPLTVGSMAQSETCAIRAGADANDIRRPIARRNEPSPFTRIGPGVNGAIKPEFVDYGGNYVFESPGRINRAEHGTAAMSFSHKPLEHLFAFDNGTSFAAPIVARTGALLWQRLQEQWPDPVSQNLIRAVLGATAEVPPEIQQLLEGCGIAHPDYVTSKVCGYGRVEHDLAVDSSETCVTLIDQNRVRLDHFLIYEIPIPPEFRRAHGTKTISVALGYDPPVRRRRLDYLGVEMDFCVIRGKTPLEVEQAYRHLPPNQPLDEADQAIGSPYRLPMQPGARRSPAGCSRKKSTLQKAAFQFTRDNPYGDTYLLVIRAERKWAPADVEFQNFGVAVTLRAEERNLYRLVAERVQARGRTRQRARATTGTGA